VHYKTPRRASSLRSDIVAAPLRPGTGAAFRTHLFWGLSHLGVRAMMGIGGQTSEKEVIMPKMSERERLADLEARQRRVSDEIIEVRRALRGKYGAIALDLAVETLTEREFRDLLAHAIRLGGAPSIAALSAITSK
jgi:hypothetical protein